MALIQVVLATGNHGKAAELGELLGALGLKVTSRPRWAADPVESGDSLEANAIIKANALMESLRDHGQASWVLADDSGLEVEALGGAPGVLSARFAGPKASDSDNITKLLESMTGVPKHLRSARFRTCVATLHPDGDIQTFEGVLHGSIALDPRGEGGFGYDPVFIPKGSDLTLAEIALDAKNAISHRALAVEAAVSAMAAKIT